MSRAQSVRALPRAPRLDADAWIAAALDALAEGGVDAIRVEPLAKNLAVTKGSFYWHFADRRALIDATILHWMNGRIHAIQSQAIDRGPPAVVLRRLARLYTRRANFKGLAIELAIRGFAQADAQAAEAIRKVDAERLEDVTRLFVGLGWGRADAEARGVLFYSFLFGQSLVDAKAVTAGARKIAIEALLAPPR
jgi:AcrR family transcriptional regulator